MTGSAPLLMALVIILAAWLLIRIPRTLFTEAAGERPATKLEWGLVAVLAVAGLAAFAASGGHSPTARLAFAVAAMVFAAVVYSDFSFLVIPDLYSAVLLVIALLSPWRLVLLDSVFGILVCGGLLAVLAFVWKMMKGDEGLGFGDVKLAAALGALLGPQQGLLAISLSAALAAALAYGARWLKQRKVANSEAVAEEEEAPLIPYGAALALAGIGFLARSLL